MGSPIRTCSAKATEEKIETTLAVEGRKRLCKLSARGNPLFAARFMGVSLGLGGFEYQYGHNDVTDHILDLAAMSHRRDGGSERGTKLTSKLRIIPTITGIKQVKSFAWAGFSCNSL